MASGGVLIGAIVAFFVIANLWKRFSKAVAQAGPAAAVPAAAPRRRPVPQRAPVPPARPASPAVAPRPSAPLPMPGLADAFPAEAAAAFDGLDLSLPDAGVSAPAAARRRRRTIGSAAVLGSRGWGAGAIVAMEVLGPPVAVRPGATLGASHAL
jgi:hypothetical protein